MTDIHHELPARPGEARRERSLNPVGGIMHIERLHTREGQDSFAGITFVPRTSRIVNPNGTVVFELKDLMAPEGWSQVAVDILAQKYFRKAGIASQLVKVHEDGIPEWLQRSRPVE